MPELPEVETIRRALESTIVGYRVAAVEVGQPILRYPVPVASLSASRGCRVLSVGRRAKYLLVELSNGSTILLHLGMSGRIVLAEAGAPRHRHDHVVFRLGGGTDLVELRLRDPRRFGAVLVAPTAGVDHHPRLRHLGPEPFDEGFSAETLYRASRGSRRAVKEWLMDGRVVVGVGNIYASETFWRARVHPAIPAGRVGVRRWRRLRDACRQVLREAIQAGGTTLRDFRDPGGNLGYFGTRLHVYGRSGEPCERCGRPIRRRRIGGRSSFYCPGCQH